MNDWAASVEEGHARTKRAELTSRRDGARHELMSRWQGDMLRGDALVAPMRQHAAVARAGGGRGLAGLGRAWGRRVRRVGKGEKILANRGYAWQGHPSQLD